MSKSKMNKLTVVLFCFMNIWQPVAISQNTIEISGHFSGSYKGQRISYFLPFDGYSNNSLPKYIFIKDSTGFFEIRDYLDHSGFIKLISGNRAIFLYSEPGQSLYFKADLSKYEGSKISLTIEGNNSEGLLLYNELNSNHLKVLNYGADLLNQAVSKDELTYDNVNKGINFYLKPFRKLYEENKISKSFYDNVVADITYSIFWQINDILKSSTSSGKRKEDEFKLRRYFYNAVIKGVPQLNQTIFGSSIYANLVGDYSTLFESDEHKILDSFYYKYGNIYKWSAVLGSMDLKYFWIQNLINEASYHSNEFDFDTVFAHYNTLYPLSEGLPLVTEILNGQGNRSGLSIQAASKKVKILNDSLPVNLSLASFCNQYFKNQVLFIDLWASWCIPCKDQFKYGKQLDSVLEKDSIKILYISINDARLSNVWLTDVFKFGLNGNHILAGKILLEDIVSKIYGHSKDGISVPRYVLISKDGKILDPDLPRPSRIDELQARLSDYKF